jgi:carbamoyl-phosphate synthase/aspartate carbamoyltransferase/dihydroorotase
VNQIAPSGLSLLFDTTRSMRAVVHKFGGDNLLQHKLLAAVFYEGSTRTSFSFQAAMSRLGGAYLAFDGHDAGNTSASKKGESLEDTIRSLECYADATVLRHPAEGSVEQVVANATKPILNAGDGVGEHPTQALLDLFTICDQLDIELNDPVEELVIVLLGDLKHGRTVHSLAKLLVRSMAEGTMLCKKLVLRYCSPESLQMPKDVQEYVADFPNVRQESLSDLNEATTQGANVLYVTRVQQERFDRQQDYDKVKNSYAVTSDVMSAAPSDMIVMHPLPRLDEISKSVDSDPRAVYFTQMQNGMFVRMALLTLILGKP